MVYEAFPRNFSPEGNFAGITARLDELKDLGVSVLWLMPIHPTGQKNKKGTIGSPYAVRDYDAINPDYGSADDLKHLVAEAHKRGIKVIIDIVANHTSWDCVLMEGHPEYYTRDAQGRVLPPNPDWSDVADLNYDNPALRDYMVGMLKRWLTGFDLDGFRCDVASEVPTAFWERVRDELAAVKPDIFLLAEATKPELLAKAFNADYAWPFHSALNDVLMYGKPATAYAMRGNRSGPPIPAERLHLRFSDNHDESARSCASASVGAGGRGPRVYSRWNSARLQRHGVRRHDRVRAPALFERLPIFRPIAHAGLSIRRSSSTSRPYGVIIPRSGPVKLSGCPPPTRTVSWRFSATTPRKSCWSRSTSRTARSRVASSTFRTLRTRSVM